MDELPAGVPAYVKDLDLPAHKVRGWVHEVEVPMRAGQRLEYESVHEPPAGRVVFNIHSHQGRDITYYRKGTGARVAGTFGAPRDGTFYLMWENTSPAAIRVAIRAVRRP